MAVAQGKSGHVADARFFYARQGSAGEEFRAPGPTTLSPEDANSSLHF
jgi:hypothetical protein